MQWFGQALAITEAHQMPERIQFLERLAQLMQSVSEQAFAVLWHEVFPDREIPLVELREILKGNRVDAE